MLEGMTRVWLVVCALVVGCNGSPDNFWRGVARATCRYNRDCTRVDVPPIGDCVDEIFADVIEPEAFAESCPDYEMSVGRACLSYVRDARQVCSVFADVESLCQDVCGSGSGMSILFLDAEGGQLALPVPSFPEPIL